MKLKINEDWLNKIYKISDMHFIFIKKHEMMGIWWILQTFLFSSKGSLAPLNIPTPTPAPDHLRLSQRDPTQFLWLSQRGP